MASLRRPLSRSVTACDCGSSPKAWKPLHSYSFSKSTAAMKPKATTSVNRFLLMNTQSYWNRDSACSRSASAFERIVEHELPRKPLFRIRAELHPPAWSWCKAMAGKRTNGDIPGNGRAMNRSLIAILLFASTHAGATSEAVKPRELVHPYPPTGPVEIAGTVAVNKVLRTMQHYAMPAFTDLLALH